MADSDEVTLFWRPGCGFCAALRRGLDGSGLSIREVDIWDDPSGASTVRSFANGNETVPTVVIGSLDSDAAFGMVNPTAREVLAAVAERAPHLLS